MFDFHPRHVLDDSNYVQYLVSQSRCPILAGKRMPVWPGVDGSARTRKAWAKFVMCNFVPWDIEVPPQITWNDYLQWEEHCKTAHASYLERSRHSMVVRLKKIGHYDRLRKSLTDDIRKRCRKIWGVRHPLDVDFNAGKEMAELKETRTEVKDTRFAEAVQDMQEAIQRAQNANKRGRSGSSEEFDVLKEALNLQLGLAPAVSHASREKETKFLYALGDDDHYPHGDDIYSHAQRVFDDIKAEEESPETDVSSTCDGHIRSTGSPDQEEIIDRITNYVRLEATCDSSAKPIAPLVFLHAGGGTGKSWVAREIHARLRQSFGWNVVRFVAPSEIAASNLAKVSTIHHALGPAVFDGDSETLQCESDKAKVHRLRKLFEGGKVLIVDEVSMVGCRMLRDIQSRLCEIMQCHDKPFGGMCVLLMGDFVQLTPVGQTELFGSVKVQVGGQHLNDVFGRELFQKFDEVSLVKQHRATDPQYAASVSAFREWTTSALQTRMEFLDTIVEITPDEFKDPTWQETTIVSTHQKTVHAVNEVMLQRFAIARGLPIVAWRLPMVDKYEKKFGHNSNFIYDTVKDMTAYFVPQAPCCLRSNLRPEKGLSNSTQGRLHSIVLHADEAQSRAQEIRDVRPGTVVMLEFPPFCVTIAIDASALSTDGMQHEDASKVVVPVMQVQRKINIHRYIAVRTKGGGSLYTHAHPFRLTFGSTYHGVQCRSMDKIILVVDDKSLPALTYNAFYVGISRVRTGDGLRVIRLRNHEEAPEDWRGRLKSLVPKVMVVRYMLKTSYENAHNLLKAMYREWDIDYDMRGHDKRMHRKGSKKSPKRGTFPCGRQCGRVFATPHHRQLHEVNCKHNPSNAHQEENVQHASIVEPHSSGKRPINTRSPGARKRQCTGTHTHTRERQEMEGDIIDTVLQPGLDEDTFINAASEARTLLDEQGQQRLERKGKQCVRDKEISPTAPSKRRHRSSASTPPTTCHATSPPKASSLSPQTSAPPACATPIQSSSSSSSSSQSMHGPPTPWVPCHISAVPGSRLVEIGSLLSKSKDKVTMAQTLLGATSAQDVRKHYLKLSVQLPPDKSKDSWATDRFQLLLKAYNLLNDK